MDVNIGNKNDDQKKNDNGAKIRKPDNRIRFRNKNRFRIPKYDNYTELNNSIENIYLATQGIEQYRKPAPKESTKKEEI